MPHMTGFELTAKVRKNDKLKELPIVLCTTRGFKEDRELGIEVGTNACVDKNRFIESNLLDIIQKLL
jgi:two-component system chemotaxis sensor kinase CheA